MRLTRLILCVGLVFSLNPLFAQQAATNYPVKPVTMIVAFPPGGGTDIVARKVAQGLNAAWGQSAPFLPRGQSQPATPSCLQPWGT